MVKRSKSVSAKPAQLALGIPNPEHFSRVAPIDETRNFGRAPRREHNFCKSKAGEVYQDALRFESHLSEFLLCCRDESCKAVRAISASQSLKKCVSCGMAARISWRYFKTARLLSWLA
jgi:hypothetical protein